MPKKVRTRPKKPSPPTSNLALTGAIWVWGAMAFYAPTYFKIAPGRWQVPFNILGAILVLVSLVGALIELSNLWNTEALSYWGAGLVFLLPAMGLQLLIIYHPPAAQALEIAAKIGIYVLLFFGVPFLFLGIPHIFWKPDSERKAQKANESTSEQQADEKKEKGKGTIKTIIAVLIVLLNLTTAIIKFVTTVIP